ncbi:MAG: MFS transporter [Streptosporangiales bacterium]|nr:MFS transporter [Streptosporangiales bacterium]
MATSARSPTSWSRTRARTCTPSSKISSRASTCTLVRTARRSHASPAATRSRSRSALGMACGMRNTRAPISSRRSARAARVDGRPTTRRSPRGLSPERPWRATVEYLDLPRSWALTGVLAGAGIEILTQPFFAWLSDRVGRRPVYAFGTAFLVLYAFPFFWLLDSGNRVLVMAAVVIGLAIGHSATGALHGPLYSEQYPTRLRYSGSSLAYQMSSVVAGAPAAFVATWLVQTTDSGKAVSIYVIVAGLISLLCVWLMKEGRDIDMSK